MKTTMKIFNTFLFSTLIVGALLITKIFYCDIPLDCVSSFLTTKSNLIIASLPSIISGTAFIISYF